MGQNTRIDWADASWNPVTGCKHGCEYCYARKIAQRFGCKITDMGNALAVLEEKYKTADGEWNPYPYEFLPTFHKYRLKIPQTWKQPKNVFVCSMADLFGDWVPDDWIDTVLTACLAAPQHRYLFLTKNPKRYPKLALDNVLVAMDNFWYGTSTPHHYDPAFWSAPSVKSNGLYYRTFLSIEPMLERFGKGSDHGSVARTDWVIVGAETGNRKNKVIPKKEWVMEILDECRERGKPIFMKESLREIMGADFIQEFPWERKNEDQQGVLPV